MSVLQKIAIRLLTLAALLGVMNFIYANYYLEQDLQKYSPIINSIRSVSKETTVLYLGESSNKMYAEMDKDKSTISQMLDALLENEVINDITKPAAHAGVYKTILENVAPKTNIKTVVVTVNLRSFAADWVFSELEASLQKEMMLLQDRPPLFNRFLLSFKAYGDNNERKRFEKINDWWQKELHLIKNKQITTVREWQQLIETSWGDTNLINRELAKNYINNFAFEITKAHPRIQDLDKIVELRKERNWNLVFTVLPENIDAINVLVGTDLIALMKENIKFLKNRYEKKKVLVVDNLMLVKNESFIDKDFPTEHYDETGRKAIAIELAKTLMKQ